MSAGDVIAIATILVQVGKNIHDRIESMHQAGAELLLLNMHLETLSQLFQGLETDTPLPSPHKLFTMLEFLAGVQKSYNKCAKVLGVEPAGTTTAIQDTAIIGKRVLKRLEIFARIPTILAEIRCKAEQLRIMNEILSLSLISDIRKHQKARNEERCVDHAAPEPDGLPDDLPDPNLRTGFASIDRMVEHLMKECECLERQLQKSTLLPDASAIQDYQARNPEGASFWKDRFQKSPLYVSALRYEIVFVSWARFVREVEKSFVLKMMPTGKRTYGDVDLLRLHGSRYSIDQNGIRHLSTIRPLWLPALRSALDPLHKGYVKPEDYFNLIHDCSLSDTLRKLVFESTGYGTVIECERATSDLPLPSAIETPSGHIGWITAQIVAIPTSAELGIFTTQDIMRSSNDAIHVCRNGTVGDVHVYVRYLQTGQIELKSLSTQIRPVGGISIGAAVSICDDLGSDDPGWSRDLHITEFKACQGGEYSITACAGSTSVEFCTRPLKTSSSGIAMSHAEDNSLRTTLPRMDHMLLGPSKVFIYPPKVGEKFQVEFDGVWYNARVTAVEGDEVEFVDWESTPKQGKNKTTRAGHRSGADEENDDSLFFSEKELKQLGKSTRRVWRSWSRNSTMYNVRPYRRFHIGDTIEATVMYPDLHFRYHDIENSQLYLPARIVDVQGDQYTVEFSPAFFVHPWWPGRMSRGTKVDQFPGSDIKLENHFDITRVTVGMDQVRPFIAGPRPALGIQSAKPFGWSSFQGIQLCELDDLLETSLWDGDCDVEC